MSKITIIEGNSNDKDNVRALMVKGERGNDGVSPTFTTSKTGDTATITITDVEGVHDVILKDGVSPTITSSKSNGVTTLTIVDAEGTKTATIEDGEVTKSYLNTALSNYYTQSDINIILDDYYYTQSEIDTTLNNYYTKSQINSTLNNYVVKDNIATITGDLVVYNGDSVRKLINFPTGFNKDNCVALACGQRVFDPDDQAGYEYGTSMKSNGSPYSFFVRLGEGDTVGSQTQIGIHYYNDEIDPLNVVTIEYKIVLMKVS